MIILYRLALYPNFSLLPGSWHGTATPVRPPNRPRLRERHPPRSAGVSPGPSQTVRAYELAAATRQAGG